MQELPAIPQVRAVNLADRAYAALEDAIVKCTLRPDQVITDRALAEQLQVSRTPVREALQRLATTGLVRPAARGWAVAGFDENDLSELFQLRRALEPLGIDRLVEADDETVAEAAHMFDRFADGVAVEDYESYFQCDHALHKLIVGASANRRVVRFYEIVEKEIDRLRHYLSVGAEGRVEGTLREHLAIAEALGRRDADGAREALLHHLNRGEEEMANYIQAERKAGRLSWPET